MAQSKKKWIWISGVLTVVIIGALVYWFVLGGNRLPVLKHVNSFTLINTENESYAFDENGDKVRLVSFIYINCPDICPITTIEMQKMQEKLKEQGLFGDKIEFVSITMDPKRDTPEALLEYAKTHKADLSGWTFLTGDEETIKGVLEDFGFYAEELDNGIYLHATRTYLVDSKNNIRAIYGMGNQMETEEILKDLVNMAN
ncbi:MAG: SCO family protein [Bacillaceae bacterium]|nr:SCO family protein [Bacillaceae bacterium]